jgi:hypothetical protein
MLKKLKIININILLKNLSGEFTKKLGHLVDFHRNNRILCVDNGLIQLILILKQDRFAKN